VIRARVNAWVWWGVGDRFVFAIDLFSFFCLFHDLFRFIEQLQLIGAGLTAFAEPALLRQTELFDKIVDVLVFFASSVRQSVTRFCNCSMWSGKDFVARFMAHIIPETPDNQRVIR
jgi:hypothetical protein